MVLMFSGCSRHTNTQKLMTTKEIYKMEGEWINQKKKERNGTEWNDENGDAMIIIQL